MALDVWLALVALFFVGGLTPGPAVMLVLASSFRYGFRPALLPAMGVASANVIWLILAASGTAVIFELYPAATLSLKIIGLIVLCWMGLSTMFGALPNLDVNAEDAPRRSRLYGKGVLLQITSPMPVVYFGMLLPTFFDPATALAPQFFTMLITVTVLEMFGLSFYAAGAQGIRKVLKGPRAARMFNVLIGLIMIISGAWAVFSTS